MVQRTPSFYSIADSQARSDDSGMSGISGHSRRFGMSATASTRTGQSSKMKEVLRVMKTAKKVRPWSHFGPRSLFLFTKRNPIRRFLMKLVTSLYFDRFILLFVFANCIVLALDDHSSGVYGIFEHIFIAVFTAEMLCKWIAMGVYWNGSSSYLRDPWNVLDFVVVLLSLTSYVDGISNLTVIRTFRVLRPLRSVRAIPGMRILITALVATLPNLFDVLVLLGFVFIIFGLIGMQLFSGMYYYRCHDLDTGAVIEDAFCSSGSRGNHCDPATQFCAHYPFLPTSGISTFDNIGLAFVTIIIIISKEGWTDIMYRTAHVTTRWSELFFILLMIIGGLFLMNLITAVVFIRFEKCKNEELERRGKAALAAMKALQLEDALVGATRDDPDAQAEDIDGQKARDSGLAGSGDGGSECTGGKDSSTGAAGSQRSSLTSRPSNSQTPKMTSQTLATLFVTRAGSSRSLLGGPRPSLTSGDSSGSPGLTARGQVASSENRPLAPEAAVDRNVEKPEEVKIPPPLKRGNSHQQLSKAAQDVALATIQHQLQRAQSKLNLRRHHSNDQSVLEDDALALNTAYNRIAGSAAKLPASIQPTIAMETKEPSPNSMGNPLLSVPEAAEDDRRRSPPMPPPTAPPTPPEPAIPPKLGAVPRKHIKSALKVAGTSNPNPTPRHVALVVEPSDRDEQGEGGDSLENGPRPPTPPPRLKSKATPGSDVSDTDHEDGNWHDPVSTTVSYTVSITRSTSTMSLSRAPSSNSADYWKEYYQDHNVALEHDVRAIEEIRLEQLEALQLPESDDVKANCERFWYMKIVVPSFYIVAHPSFSIIVNIIVILNIFVLSLTHYGMSSEWSTTLHAFNYVFTILFAIELLLKIIGLSPKLFIRDTFNIFDTAIVIVSIVDIILSEDDGNQVAHLFRALRAFRVFKLIRGWTFLRGMLNAILMSIVELAYFGILLILFSFVFAILGKTLFKDKLHCHDQLTGDYGRCRTNFDSFPFALLAVFQVLTAENWNDVLVSAVEGTGYASCIYFIILLFFGNYIVVAIFFAILLSNVQQDVQEEPIGANDALELENLDQSPAPELMKFIRSDAGAPADEDGQVPARPKTPNVPPLRLAPEELADNHVSEDGELGSQLPTTTSTHADRQDPALDPITSRDVDISSSLPAVRIHQDPAAGIEGRESKQSSTSTHTSLDYYTEEELANDPTLKEKATKWRMSLSKQSSHRMSIIVSPAPENQDPQPSPSPRSTVDPTNLFSPIDTRTQDTLSPSTAPSRSRSPSHADSSLRLLSSGDSTHDEHELLAEAREAAMEFIRQHRGSTVDPLKLTSFTVEASPTKTSLADLFKFHSPSRFDDSPNHQSTTIHPHAPSSQLEHELQEQEQKARKAALDAFHAADAARQRGDIEEANDQDARGHAFVVEQMVAALRLKKLRSAPQRHQSQGHKSKPMSFMQLAQQQAHQLQMHHSHLSHLPRLTNRRPSHSPHETPGVPSSDLEEQGRHAENERPRSSGGSPKRPPKRSKSFRPPKGDKEHSFPSPITGSSPNSIRPSTYHLDNSSDSERDADLSSDEGKRERLTPTRRRRSTLQDAPKSRLGHLVDVKVGRNSIDGSEIGRMDGAADMQTFGAKNGDERVPDHSECHQSVTSLSSHDPNTATGTDTTPMVAPLQPQIVQEALGMLSEDGLASLRGPKSKRLHIPLSTSDLSYNAISDGGSDASGGQPRSRESQLRHYPSSSGTQSKERRRPSQVQDGTRLDGDTSEGPPALNRRRSVVLFSGNFDPISAELDPGVRLARLNRLSQQFDPSVVTGGDSRFDIIPIETASQPRGSVRSSLVREPSSLPHTKSEQDLSPDGARRSEEASDDDAIESYEEDQTMAEEYELPCLHRLWNQFVGGFFAFFNKNNNLEHTILLDAVKVAPDPDLAQAAMKSPQPRTSVAQPVPPHAVHDYHSLLEHASSIQSEYYPCNVSQPSEPSRQSAPSQPLTLQQALPVGYTQLQLQLPSRSPTPQHTYFSPSGRGSLVPSNRGMVPLASMNPFGSPLATPSSALHHQPSEMLRRSSLEPLRLNSASVGPAPFLPLKSTGSETVSARFVFPHPRPQPNHLIVEPTNIGLTPSAPKSPLPSPRDGDGAATVAAQQLPSFRASQSSLLSRPALTPPSALVEVGASTKDTESQEQTVTDTNTTKVQEQIVTDEEGVKRSPNREASPTPDTRKEASGSAWPEKTKLDTTGDAETRGPMTEGFMTSQPEPPRQVTLRGRSLGCLPPQHRLRVIAAIFINHPGFSMFMLMLIAYNTVILILNDALVKPGSFEAKFYETSDLVISIIFAVEALLKIVVFGLIRHEGAYLRQGWNIIEFVIVVTSILNLIFPSTLSSFRAFRALRPLRLLGQFASMNTIIASIVASAKALGKVLLVGGFFFLVFAIIGVEFFRGKLYRCEAMHFDGSLEVMYGVNRDQCEMLIANNDNEGALRAVMGLPSPYGPGDPPPPIISWKSPTGLNFDSVPNAFIILFEICTFEMWPQILSQTMDATNDYSGPIRDASSVAPLYFVAFVLVGGFFVVSLFVGAIVDEYKRHREEETGAIYLTDDQRAYLESFKDISSVVPPSRLLPPFAPVCCRCRNERIAQLRREYRRREAIRQQEIEAEERLKRELLRRRAAGHDSKQGSALGPSLAHLPSLPHPQLDNASITESPLIRPMMTPMERKDSLDVFKNSPPLSSLPSLLSSGNVPPALARQGSLRVFTPLDEGKLSPTLLTRTLEAGGDKTSPTLVMSPMITRTPSHALHFDSLRLKQDDEEGEIQVTDEEAEPVLQPDGSYAKPKKTIRRKKTNPERSPESALVSLRARSASKLKLIDSFTSASLPSTSGHSEDAVATSGSQSEHGDLRARYGFTAEEIDTFVRKLNKSEEELLEPNPAHTRGLQFVFTNAAEEERTAKQLYREALEYVSPFYETRFRQQIFHVVVNDKFETFIMCIIVINTISMSMYYYGQPADYDLAISWINDACTWILFAEVVLKCIGLGFRQYLSPSSNVFDAVVVMLSLVPFFLRQSESGPNSIGVDPNLFRIFRIFRVLRLARSAPGIQLLISTVVYSVPVIMSLGVLMVSLLFVYAIAGMALFGTVRYGSYLNEDANFETFLRSMVTLFRSSTGESWNGIMHDLMVQPPFCAAQKCGYPTLAPIYFMTFIVLATFLLLNVLVAVIVDNFENEVNKDEGDASVVITRQQIEKFAECWAQWREVQIRTELMLEAEGAAGEQMVLASDEEHVEEEDDDTEGTKRSNSSTSSTGSHRTSTSRDGVKEGVRKDPPGTKAESDTSPATRGTKRRVENASTRRGSVKPVDPPRRGSVASGLTRRGSAQAVKSPSGDSVPELTEDDKEIILEAIKVVCQLGPSPEPEALRGCIELSSGQVITLASIYSRFYQMLPKLHAAQLEMLQRFQEALYEQQELQLAELTASHPPVSPTPHGPSHTDSPIASWTRETSFNSVIKLTPHSSEHNQLAQGTPQHPQPQNESSSGDGNSTIQGPSIPNLSRESSTLRTSSQMPPARASIFARSDRTPPLPAIATAVESSTEGPQRQGSPSIELGHYPNLLKLNSRDLHDTPPVLTRPATLGAEPVSTRVNDRDQKLLHPGSATPNHHAPTTPINPRKMTHKQRNASMPMPVDDDALLKPPSEARGSPVTAQDNTVPLPGALIFAEPAAGVGSAATRPSQRPPVPPINTFTSVRSSQSAGSSASSQGVGGGATHVAGSLVQQSSGTLSLVTPEMPATHLDFRVSVTTPKPPSDSSASGIAARRMSAVGQRQSLTLEQRASLFRTPSTAPQPDDMEDDSKTCCCDLGESLRTSLRTCFASCTSTIARAFKNLVETLTCSTESVLAHHPMWMHVGKVGLFLNSAPAPLGFSNEPLSGAELIKLMARLEVHQYRGYVHYVDLVLSLVRNLYGKEACRIPEQNERLKAATAMMHSNFPQLSKIKGRNFSAASTFGTIVIQRRLRRIIERFRTRRLISNVISEFFEEQLKQDEAFYQEQLEERKKEIDMYIQQYILLQSHPHTPLSRAYSNFSRQIDKVDEEGEESLPSPRQSKPSGFTIDFSQPPEPDGGQETFDWGLPPG